MFWKIVGGIVAFFLVVALAVTLLATAGLAAFGAAVGSIIEELDISTVQVTDASGNTETYNVNDLAAESGRVEITGEDGERVTIDLDVPRITVREGGEESSRVVIGGGPRPRVEVNPDVPQIRIDGRDIVDHDFDGRFFLRPIASFFRVMFNLVVWSLILVGIWLLVRNRRPAVDEPKEKSPDATA